MLRPVLGQLLCSFPHELPSLYTSIRRQADEEASLRCCFRNTPSPLKVNQRKLAGAFMCLLASFLLLLSKASTVGFCSACGVFRIQTGQLLSEPR